jgi:alkylglycerol monooxygenase
VNEHTCWRGTLAGVGPDDLILAASIPIFFLLILVERQVDRRDATRKLYRFHDAITDLSCGIGSTVMGVVWGGLFVLAYIQLVPHRFFDLEGPVEWLVAFILYDFAYYWWHRANHRINVLWAAHIVHHQSEDYNLAVALRQAWFTGWSAWIFYLPLALIGIDTEVYLATAALNTIGQFWFHTRAIGRMGWFESWLNTPSHHRVHHGIDPIYIDKNYAGILIIWDRLFGTFKEEEHEPTYGTVEPLRSWNPVWANFQYYGVIAAKMKKAPGLMKLWVPFAPPEWTADGPLEIPEPSHEAYSTEVSPTLLKYVVVHFLPVAVMVLALLAVPLEREIQLLLVFLAVVTTAMWGGLFEQKWWAVPLERARLVALALASALLGPWGIAIGVSIAAASWVILPRCFSSSSPAAPVATT